MGLITPRTGQTNLSGVSFHHFHQGSSALVTCSGCDDPDYFTNLGTELFFTGAYFSAVVGQHV